MLKGLLMSQIQHYGNAVIFIGLILEYVGMPIPGETVMSFLGFMSWKSADTPVYLSFIFAVTGTIIGSNIAWFIGYKYGEDVLLKYGKHFNITKEKLNKTGLLLDKHRVSLLIFGRYVPGVRHIVPYLSGISRLKFGTFLLYNITSSIIWCASFIGLGFLLGEKWMVAEKLIKAYSLILILLMIFVFVVIKYFNKHIKIIFAIVFPMLGFIKLSEELISNELSVFDNQIYKYITKLISEDMTDFMRFLSFAGSAQVLILITLVSLVVFWRHKKYSFYSKMLAVNLFAVSVLNEAFKVLFHRARPDILRLVEAGGFSFPSGHSMIGLSFYGLIAYLLYSNINNIWRYFIAAFFAILIIAIGISRIYLGVHYASDVLAGFSVGLAWLAIFITVINRIYNTKMKPIEQD